MGHPAASGTRAAGGQGWGDGYRMLPMGFERAAAFFFFFLIEGRSEYAKVSNKAFPFGGRGRLVLTGRTDGVKVGPRAGGQRSPIKAVAKYAGRCHLTVTPAPTAREPLFTTARRGARAGSPALERQSPGS